LRYANQILYFNNARIDDVSFFHHFKIDSFIEISEDFSFQIHGKTDSELKLRPALRNHGQRPEGSPLGGRPEGSPLKN
jgi:hypothetical protein